MRKLISGLTCSSSFFICQSTQPCPATLPLNNSNLVSANISGISNVYEFNFTPSKCHCKLPDWLPILGAALIRIQIKSLAAFTRSCELICCPVGACRNNKLPAKLAAGIGQPSMLDLLVLICTWQGLVILSIVIKGRQDTWL